MAIFPHDIGKRGFKEQNGIFMKQSKNKYKFPQSILSMNLDYNLKLNSWNNKEPQINLYLVINAPQKCKKSSNLTTVPAPRTAIHEPNGMFQDILGSVIWLSNSHFWVKTTICHGIQQLKQQKLLDISIS